MLFLCFGMSASIPAAAYVEWNAGGVVSGAEHFRHTNLNGGAAVGLWNATLQTGLSAGANAGSRLAVSIPGQPAANATVFRDRTMTLTGSILTFPAGAGNAAIIVDTNYGNDTSSNLSQIPEPRTWSMISLGFFLFFARCKVLAPAQ